MDTKLNFITKCTRELLANGFSVLIHRKKELDGYGGWFGAEDGERELVVALDHDMGFEVFLHEYCHYLQWKNNRDLWDRSLLTYDTLFEWIDKPESNYTDEELNQSLHDILELEHDCETKALKLLHNNPIEDVSVDKYIRAVNAYLLHYHINRSLRKRPKNPIYSDRVLSHMPNKFSANLAYYLDSGNITEPMRAALLQEYEETQESR
jgi:hypothetical protein